MDAVLNGTVPKGAAANLCWIAISLDNKQVIFNELVRLISASVAQIVFDLTQIKEPTIHIGYAQNTPSHETGFGVRS